MSTVDLERSRLGDLLVDMRLVDEAMMRSVLAEHRVTGRRIARILAERRVIDEDQLTRAVAAKLGLEAVSVTGVRIHERVLALVPSSIAKAHGVLPIAVKRTSQAELVYLVMANPLDERAISEVQRSAGRQVRVLMAKASEIDDVIEQHYGARSTSTGVTPSPRAVAVISRAPTELGDWSSEGSERPTATDERAPETLPPVQVHDRGDESMVTPSELDPPDAVSTKIDDPFVGLDDARTSTHEVSADQIDQWDQAVRGWDVDARNAPERDASLAESLADPVGAPGPIEPQTGDDLVTALAPIDELDWGAEASDASAAPAPTRSDPAPSRSAPATSVPKVSKRLLATALEIPINWEDDSHPFEGPGPSQMRVGLERTAIIPASELGDLQFSPPPLDEPYASAEALAGSDDIPTSAAAVEARSASVDADLDDPFPADGEDVAPLDDDDIVAHQPEAETKRPSVSTDSMRIPVIEPSRLISLIEEEDDPASEDTGSDPVPYDPAPTPTDPPPERKTADLPADGLVLAPPRPQIVGPPTGDLIAEPPPSPAPPSRDPSLISAPSAGARSASSEAMRHATTLVASLRSGASLSSAQRAELLLALGRVLLDKGLIHESELLKALLDGA